MAQSISQEEQTELKRLLERARQAIPYLRLDKADEVKSSFEAAMSLLQKSLVSSDILSKIGSGADDIDDTPALSRQPPEFIGDANDDAGNFSSDGEDQDLRVEALPDNLLQQDDPPSPRSVDAPNYVKALPKQIVAARGVTRDFSSPSMRKRQLGGGTSASAPTSPAQSSIGTAGGNRPAASSRAGVSSRAGAQGGSVGLGLGLGLRPKEKTGGGAEDLRKQMLKNNPAAPVPRGVTRDFDSPKLGSRKLGGRNLDGEEGDSSSVKPSQSVGASAQDTEDLVRSEKTPMSEGLLEAPHSPMQVSANRHLLGLAAGGANSQSDPSPSKQSVAPFKSSRVPKIPGSPGSYLRPLNHPSTRAAELITAKVQLKKLIKEAQQLTPFIRADAFQEVRQNLLQSVLLLEESTTMAKKDPPGGGK